MQTHGFFCLFRLRKLKKYRGIIKENGEFYEVVCIQKFISVIQ